MFYVWFCDLIDQADWLPSLNTWTWEIFEESKRLPVVKFIRFFEGLEKDQFIFRDLPGGRYVTMSVWR